MTTIQLHDLPLADLANHIAAQPVDKNRIQNLGGAELAYAAITAPVTISHTSEGAADTIVTSNSVTYDGTVVWVHFFAPSYTTSAGTNTFVVLRDATVLGQASHVGSSGGDPVNVWVRDTPSPGAHTYKVAAFVNTSTATVGAGAGGSGNAVAAFVRVVAA